MKKFFKKLINIVINFGKTRITDSVADIEILGNREILGSQSREIWHELEKNRKPTISSGLPGHQQARESSSTLDVIIANSQKVSSPPVDIVLETVEVPGVEPGRSELTSSTSQPATPTVKPSYQLLCHYCNGKNFVKRGKRKKKLEEVQLYLCRNCNKTFTAEFVKGKHFPLKVVIEGINFYNLGFTLEETCRILKAKFGVAPESSTLSDWIKEYEKLCTYSRLRPYATKLCKPEKTVETTTMAHRQLYRFRYHRPKLHLLITEHFKHRQFEALKDYLDAVSAETPHQYFQDGIRMSEVKSKFDKAQMIVRAKQNYANELAKFVLQAVKENKDRHEEVQRFMIANDSVTVATEVPVYIRKEDIEHMQNQLNFKILDSENPEIELKGGKKVKEIPKLMTGHIDVLQVRNGLCHILDYKPNAAKEKPIEQLTWYALALSRLTGLRLYEFKCAWFDEKDYFEFYPLHVVYKLKKLKRKNIKFKSGAVVELPVENKLAMA